MKKVLKFIYPEKNSENRLYLIDTIRGFTVLNMIVYHALYDAVYMCGFDIKWFEGKPGDIWELLISSVFIILSGLCINISNHPVKRGLTVFGAGLIVSFVTFVFIPEERIIFGILTFFGCAMLFTALIRRLLESINPFVVLSVCLILFLLTYSINYGYIGFFNHKIIYLPEILYNGYLMTFLGFSDNSFYSSDYFSFMPWIFLFVSGFAIGKIIHIESLSENIDKRKKIYNLRLPVLTFTGQRALLIYLLHQPILYIFVLIINR